LPHRRCGCIAEPRERHAQAASEPDAELASINASGNFVDGRCVHIPFAGMEARVLDSGILVRQLKGAPDVDGKVKLVISVRMMYWFERNKDTKQPDASRVPKRCHANVEVLVPGEPPLRPRPPPHDATARFCTCF